MVHLGLPKRVVREWISRTHSTFDTSNRAVAFLGVCHRSSPLLPLILLLLSLFLSFRFLSFSAVAAATTMRVISAALDADWSLKTAADDEPIFTTCPRRLVFFCNFIIRSSFSLPFSTPSGDEWKRRRRRTAAIYPHRVSSVISLLVVFFLAPTLRNPIIVIDFQRSLRWR